MWVGILVPIEVNKDDRSNVVHEEGYKDLFYEEYNHPVINSISDGFKKDFSMLIYDEYEDDYLDHALEEPTICNHGLDHLEETEGPKWDVSSCFSNLESLEECISPDFIDEGKDSKWDIPLCFSNSEFFSWFY